MLYFPSVLDRNFLPQEPTPREGTASGLRKDVASLSPLFEELSRLTRRYHDACESPFSCPRDRDILRDRIADLEEMTLTLRVKAAKAAEINEAERERLSLNLERLRVVRAALKGSSSQPGWKELDESLSFHIGYLAVVLKCLNKEQTA